MGPCVPAWKKFRLHSTIADEHWSNTWLSGQHGYVAPRFINKHFDSAREEMATRKLAYTMLVVLLSVPVLAWDQEVERPTGGVVNFVEPILPDPVLQHSKEVYVLNGCAYCHGVDLKVRNGEAADLLHSPIVAADKNGSVIGPLLRQGIPQTAKLSPMPS